MMSARRRGPTGLAGFTVVWFGQFISMLGSGMTSFAITIWAYELTGKASALALVAFFSFAPVIAFSPLAGAIVDRVSRKLVMAASDIGAGLATVALLVLQATGHLQLWHLFVTGFLAGALGAFQFPAYSAAVTTMVDKKHYARTSGMLGLADSASGIIAPILGGGLYVLIGLRGIMLVDLATLAVALAALLIVHIPEPKREEIVEATSSLWSDCVFGFRYIIARRSLLGIQLLMLGVNFVSTFGFAVMAPMILARTGNNSVVFGAVEMAGSVGGLAGGAVMALWGGAKRKIHGVLLGMALAGIGSLLLGVGQGIVAWWVGSFIATFMAVSIVNGSNQAIWQSKVPPAMQGRVFATRRMIAQGMIPVATLSAGFCADRVFEPLMRSGSPTASALGHIVGIGPGAGMGLMLVLAALLRIAISLGGYAFPAVRNVETLIPDHDATPAGVADVSEAAD
jgi:MFS family permease